MSAKRENTRDEKKERALFLFFRRACSRASPSPNAQAPVVQATTSVVCAQLRRHFEQEMLVLANTS